VTPAWIEYYNRQDGVRRRPVVQEARRRGAPAHPLPDLAPHRNDNGKPLRMLIMGIPNVGKSTLMNVCSSARLPRSATSRR
jgi:ribosome biogenesis GTPase A